MTGTDKGAPQGQRAQDTASTTLTQPAAPALPETPIDERPGQRAKLRGTVGCATREYASATVSGKRIKSVTYTVNGKKVRTLTKPTSGSTYSLRLQGP